MNRARMEGRRGAVMVAWLAAQLLVAAAVCAQPATRAKADAPASQASASSLDGVAPVVRPGLTDEIIRKAVRETIAQEASPPDHASSGAAAYSASTRTTQDRMAAAFEQAKVPDCLHQDALKHQPASIGPIAVVGPFSLPWVVAAIVRGKCN